MPESSITGLFKDKLERYAAVYTQETGLWRICDRWHEDLLKYGDIENDEIPDSSPAITLIPDMAFTALINEAKRIGIAQRYIASIPDPKNGEAEAAATGKIMLMEKRIAELEQQLREKESTPIFTEQYHTRKQAMETVLKLAGMAEVNK